MKSLQSNTLQIYYGDTTNVSASGYEKHLSVFEKQKAGNIKLESDKACYMISKVWLRNILAFHTATDATNIEYEFNIYGKPYLKNRKDIQFNLAHSDNMVLIGIIKEHNIGIDIERTDRNIEFEKLTELLFSKNEYVQFQKTKFEDQNESFINCWTRKEAFSKAKGNGLTFPINQLEVTFLKGLKAQLVATPWDIQEKERWFMDSFDLKEKFRCAVAVEGNVRSIDFFDINHIINN